MKTGSADLVAAAEARVIAPIWFVELSLSSTLRYNSTSANITYDGDVYTTQDFRVSGITLGNSGSTNATVSFQGIDNTFTALFRQPGVEGSTVNIWWAVEQDSYTDASDAYHCVQSTIDSLSLNPNTISLRLARQPIYVPSKRVDVANGFTLMTGAGLVQTPGGGQVLV